jgi:hypothetical protein
MAGPPLQLLVIGKLIRLQLFRRFRVFVAFISVDAAGSVVLWTLDSSAATAAYRNAWMTVECVSLLLKIGAVLELFRLLYESYPGIDSFARNLILAACTVALTVSLGGIPIEVRHIHWRFPDLQSAFLGERVTSLALGLLIFITMALFPRSTSARNILLHGWLLSGMFLSTAVTFFAINISNRTDLPATLWGMAQLACYTGWIVGLRPPIVVRRTFSNEELARTEKERERFDLVARFLLRETLRQMFKRHE